MRKPRPLTRDKATFRDDRLLIIACDDTHAPAQYFEFFEFSRIKVHVVPTTDGTSVAEHVLDRLLSFGYDPDDQRWLLLDTDHVISGTHLASTTAALQRARQAGIEVAFSRPCFELWLLLHHRDPEQVASLSTAEDVEQALRDALGSYNKTRLDRSHYPTELAEKAYNRAKLLDEAVTGGDIPDSVTTRVYRIWQQLRSFLQGRVANP